MATVNYNSVAITNAKITRFATENEFESDNRNRTGKKHILEGVGVYRNTSGFNTSITAIRNALSVPGQLLFIQFDGEAPLNLAHGADAVGLYASIRDTRNGPKPTVTVTEITGGNIGTFLIGFSFEWHNCNSSPIQRAEVTITHTIDEEGLSTVDRKGFIRISAANTGTQGPASTPVASTESLQPKSPYPNITALQMQPTLYSATPSDYRRFVAGMVPKGFRRTKQEFYVQQDQQTLVFNITDTQVVASLPSPVIAGDASFEYERGIEGNEVGRKTFRCSFIGPPANSDDPATGTAGAMTYSEMRATLFLRALETAMTRINFDPKYGDAVMSFKITETSLFKKNEIAFEVIAKGAQTHTSFYEPGELSDLNLYSLLFDPPNYDAIPPIDVPAYGFGAYNIGYTPRFKFDPCTLANTWQQLTGSTKGTSVTLVPQAEQNRTIENPNNNRFGKKISERDTVGKPDQRLKTDADEAIFTYNATQRIDSKTGMTSLENMGGQQFNFQMALPRVFITQTVEMATKTRGMSIPWPVITDPYTVIEQNIEMNDGPVDASGKRMIAVRATRTIQIKVSDSQNLRTVADANEANARAVWMPDSILLPRNAYGGSTTIPLTQNMNGIVSQQDYVGKDNLPGT